MKQPNFTSFLLFFQTGKLLQGHEPEARQTLTETLRYNQKERPLIHQLAEDGKAHLLRDLLNLNVSAQRARDQMEQEGDFEALEGNQGPVIDIN